MDRLDSNIDMYAHVWLEKRDINKLIHVISLNLDTFAHDRY
jgi:hypothetical protein